MSILSRQIIKYQFYKFAMQHWDFFFIYPNRPYWCLILVDANKLANQNFNTVFNKQRKVFRMRIIYKVFIKYKPVFVRSFFYSKLWIYFVAFCFPSLETLKRFVTFFNTFYFCHQELRKERKPSSCCGFLSLLRYQKIYDFNLNLRPVNPQS